MSLRLPASVLRLVVLGVAAVGFAALAVFLVNRHITDSLERHRAASRTAPSPTVSVVVAKFDLIAGEAVGLDNMAIRQIPVDLAPGSALRPDQFDAKVGMRLARALRSGEPLLAEILHASEPGGLSSRVRQGIRALTIAVDDVNAVSGMLRPGDRIDLLFSARASTMEASAAVETTRVLVQDVAVLATGRQFRQAADEPAARPFTSITVELSPEDAKRLVVAQRTGRITALLRNPDDRHAVSTSPLDANTLMGVQQREATPQPRPPARTGPEMIIGGGGAVSVGRTLPAHEAAVALVGGGGDSGLTSSQTRAERSLASSDPSAGRAVASGGAYPNPGPTLSSGLPSAAPGAGGGPLLPNSTAATAPPWVQPSFVQPLLIR